MTSFSTATFWSSFLAGRFFGGADYFSFFCCRASSSCAASMLLNCIAAAVAVSSPLHLNLSTYFLIAYSFPISRAQPNNNNSPRVFKVAPHGRMTSLQFFFTVVVCSSSTSCISGRTTAANISSVIGDQANLLNSTLSVIAISDGHLPSVQEG